jgi:hypothetical protein
MGAPVQNPNDGTTLGTSEVISDEAIDPQVGGRRDQYLPVTLYKAPRSKIAVGPYGQDWGDATQDQPLAVESRSQRQIAETVSLTQRDQAQSDFIAAAGFHNLTLSDSRGAHFSNRGTR